MQMGLLVGTNLSFFKRNKSSLNTPKKLFGYKEGNNLFVNDQPTSILGTRPQSVVTSPTLGMVLE